MNQFRMINRTGAQILCAVAALAPLAAGCGAQAASAHTTTAVASASSTAKTQLVTGTVYGDNSFELYVNGTKVAQDPIAFKPFNIVKVRFRASYPMTFAFKGIDYVQDASTGLEYNNTKAGDGGLIATFSNGVVTDGTWKSFVTSTGPTNLTACLASPSVCKVVNTAAPARWTTASTATWKKASTYTVAQVQPHVDNFSSVGWGKANFIWGSDLVADNTVLLRKTVAAAPGATSTAAATGTAATTRASMETSTSVTTSASSATSTSCATHKASFRRFAKRVKLMCDSTDLYLSSTMVPNDETMVGITGWNQQVPLPAPVTTALSGMWRVPLSPTYSKTTTPTTGVGATAIMVNGVPLFNATKPSRNGDQSTYSAAADPKLQGELDTCDGHAGRGDDYHYHAYPVCMMKTVGSSAGLAGYVLDGFPIYGTNERAGVTATGLDKCSGHDIGDGRGYHYHLTKAAPYSPMCFHGTLPAGSTTPEQPVTAPLRLPGEPVKVLITSMKFRPTGTSVLTYRYNGKTGSVSYTPTSTGCWRFTYNNMLPNPLGVGTQTVCRAKR